MREPFSRITASNVAPSPSTSNSLLMKDGGESSSKAGLDANNNIVKWLLNNSNNNNNNASFGNDENYNPRVFDSSPSRKAMKSSVMNQLVNSPLTHHQRKDSDQWRSKKSQELEEFERLEKFVMSESGDNATEKVSQMDNRELDLCLKDLETTTTTTTSCVKSDPKEKILKELNERQQQRKIKDEDFEILNSSLFKSHQATTKQKEMDDDDLFLDQFNGNNLGGGHDGTEGIKPIFNESMMRHSILQDKFMDDDIEPLQEDKNMHFLKNPQPKPEPEPELELSPHNKRKPLLEIPYSSSDGAATNSKAKNFASDPGNSKEGLETRRKELFERKGRGKAEEKEKEYLYDDDDDEEEEDVEEEESELSQPPSQFLASLFPGLRSNSAVDAKQLQTKFEEQKFNSTEKEISTTLEEEVKKYKALSEKLKRQTSQHQRKVLKWQSECIAWEKKKQEQEILWQKQKEEDLRRLKRERDRLLGNNAAAAASASLSDTVTSNEKREISILKEQIKLLQEGSKAKVVKLSLEIDRLKAQNEYLKKEKEALFQENNELKEKNSALLERTGKKENNLLNRVYNNALNVGMGKRRLISKSVSTQTCPDAERIDFLVNSREDGEEDGERADGEEKKTSINNNNDNDEDGGDEEDNFILVVKPREGNVLNYCKKYDLEVGKNNTNAEEEDKSNIPKFDREYPTLDWKELEEYDREEVFPDGKRIRSDQGTNRQWTLYKNGTIKLCPLFPGASKAAAAATAAAQRTIIFFTNGDVKVLEEVLESSSSDSSSSQVGSIARTIYYYAGSKTIHTCEGSVQKYEFLNGQIEYVYEDGERRVIFPDGTKKIVYPDQSERSEFTDGTVQISNPLQKTRTINFTNGIIEFYSPQFKKRTLPNGNCKIVYPNGASKTFISLSRVITVKDENGRVVRQRLGTNLEEEDYTK